MTTKAQKIGAARKLMEQANWAWSQAKTDDERKTTYEAFMKTVAGARAAELEPDEVAQPPVVSPKVVPIRGTQAGDSYEHSYLPAGAANVLTPAKMDRMLAAGITGLREPFLAMARCDINGKISDSFIAIMKNQVDMGLARFLRVVLDPLHHVNLWKGAKAHAVNYDAFKQGIGGLTNDQYEAIALANLKQIALAFRDYPLTLEFDLLNEPHVGRVYGGITREGTHAFYAKAVPMIRATGGNNATRRLWLQPYGELETLVVPAGDKNLGLSHHIYAPDEFSHGEATKLTAGHLVAFEAEAMAAKALADARGIPLMIGEAGTSLVTRNAKMIREPADRAEYVAHVLNVCKGLGIDVYTWDHATAFGQYDEAAKAWRPGMAEAIAGNLPVRAYPRPQLIDTSKGVLLKGSVAGVTFKDGAISFPDFPMTDQQQWRFATVVFPATKMTQAARVKPDGDNPGLKIQVMTYKPGPNGTYVQAKQVADGKTIGSGYRTVEGVPSTVTTLEDGAFVAAYIEQIQGSPAQSVRLAGWSA